MPPRYSACRVSGSLAPAALFSGTDALIRSVEALGRNDFTFLYAQLIVECSSASDSDACRSAVESPKELHRDCADGPDPGAPQDLSPIAAHGAGGERPILQEFPRHAAGVV